MNKKGFTWDKIIAIFFQIGLFVWIEAGYAAILMSSGSSLKGSFFGMLLVTAVCMLGFFFVLAVNTVVHEAGHLVFGLLTGYKFIEFRVFKFAFTRTDRGIKFSRKTVFGTAGQCLLAPPEYDRKNFSYKWYFLGGGIFNLILALLLLIVALLIKNVPVSRFFICSSGLSLLFGLMNLIPINYNIGNDGYDVLSASRDEKERYYLWLTLKYVEFSMLGGENIIPQIESIREDELAKRLQYKGAPTMLAVKLSAYISRNEFEKAVSLADRLLKSDEIMQALRYSFCVERLFLELIGNNDAEIIDELYDKKLKKYVEKTHLSNIQSARLRHALLLLNEGNLPLAAKEEEVLSRLISNHPSEFEKAEEIRLLELVKERAKFKA